MLGGKIISYKFSFLFHFFQMSVEADGTPQKVPIVRISSTVSFSTDIDKESTTNIKATNAPNKELCIQWYLPFLEKSSNEKEMMVLLNERGVILELFFFLKK